MGKYKDEVPMCQVPVKILKRDARTSKQVNSSKQSLKICISKKRWMFITSILKLWNFSEGDVISDYEFLFLILTAFTVGTEEYPECYKVNDAKGLQIIYHDCSIIL